MCADRILLLQFKMLLGDLPDGYQVDPRIIVYVWCDRQLVKAVHLGH